MKIVIPGGTGQIGTDLARTFIRDKHEVVVLSRRRLTLPWPVVSWDGRSGGEWEREIDGADAVINLSGRSVNCRYTPTNRRQIMESRVSSVRAVGEAIAKAARPPAVWLQMSTATIYAHRYDAANDEATGILGGSEAAIPDSWRFSVSVAKAWEAALESAETPRTRKVALRAAMVMSASAGGVFDTLLKLVRLGLGGQVGDGAQYVSWVHAYDFERAVYRIVMHDELSGPVNISAPHPVSNAEFMRVFRRAAGRPIGLPIPEQLLELGARMLKTETELLLKSRRVVPTKLMKSGFEFVFPTWALAADDLVSERSRRRAEAKRQ